MERLKNSKSILILGGSVVNTYWSRMENRLDTLLQKKYPQQKFRFYNVAMAGHTSKDNRIKYQLLSKQYFDLVIYYEGINENRANNVSKKQFSDEYLHIQWYDDINLIQRHPEMNITVIPYATDFMLKFIYDKISGRTYISNENVEPENAKFGNEIKTQLPYFQNLNTIAKLATRKKDPLLLVKYASFFPKKILLTGNQNDKVYFSPCYIMSPVTTWGTAKNVQNGIAVHNIMLQKVANLNKTYLFDMPAALPQDSSMFCDVCHLSEKGARRFALELSKFIISSKVLEK